MRITCPNCGAQYEVPEQVIPSEGRDVQCSSCGSTWFQAHPSQEAAPLDDGADLIAPEPEPEPEPERPQDPEPEIAAPPVAEPDDAPPAAPKRRELDPEVADILREEAEHESRKREGEAAVGLESQSDLGLDALGDDEATRRAREARERMARMRGEDPETENEPQEDSPDLTPRPRSRLLPDIDEVTTTIKSEDPPVAIQTGAEMAVADPPVKRGGFGRGFSLIILLGVVLVVLYLNASQISSSVPALSGVLDAYVVQVDKLRIWLDARLSGFIPQ